MLEEIKPIKRSEQLAPLSREHHDGLMYKRRIKKRRIYRQTKTIYHLVLAATYQTTFLPGRKNLIAVRAGKS
jgi:hypothetical protein